MRRPVNVGDSQVWVPPVLDPADAFERAQRRRLKLERANIDHQRAVRIVDSWLRELGFSTFEADYDILATRTNLWVLVEVKLIRTADPRRQTIAAIGQLACYASLSIGPLPSETALVKVVAFDRHPSDARSLFVLESEGIQTVWVEPEVESVELAEYSRATLSLQAG